MCCPKKLSLSSLQVLKSSAIRPRTFPLSLFSRLRTLLCLTKRPAIFSTFIPNRTEIIIHHLNHEICVNWRKKSIFKENQDSSLDLSHYVSKVHQSPLLLFACGWSAGKYFNTVSDTFVGWTRQEKEVEHHSGKWLL